MVKKTITYDDKTLKEFFKFHFKKFNLIFYVCASLLVLCGIVYLCSSKIFSGILTTLLGIFFAFYPMILVATSLGQNRKMLDTTEYIEFGETEMKVVSERFGEEISNSTVKYSALEKLVSDKEFLYIYITKNSAIPLHKADLTKEEYDFIVRNITNNIKSANKK